MPSHDLPRSHAAFLEYVNRCHSRVIAYASDYGILPEKIVGFTADYNAFVAAELRASDPMMGGPLAINERNRCQDKLEATWRGFRNANIRFNELVSAEDKAFFGFKLRSGARRHVGKPVKAGSVRFVRMGVCEFRVEVRNADTGKLRNPEDAAGSYLYTAVTDLAESPAHADFRKGTLASDNVHKLCFTSDNIGRRGHVYARYANIHGQEGPMGAVETVVIC